MSQRILAIKCPQCGSVEKRETKRNHYCCSSCHTEYFVDTNEVTHYHYQANTEEPSEPRSNRTLIRFIFVFIALFIFFYTILTQINERVLSSSHPTKNTPSRPQQAANSIDEKVMTWLGSPSVFFFYNSKNEPKMAMVGVYGRYRKYGEMGDGKPMSVVFYDPITAQFSQPAPLNITQAFNSSRVIQHPTGETYFIANGKHIFWLDKDALALKNITQELMDKNEKLYAGFSEVHKSPSGNGFRLYTNDGKELQYFPAENKAYTRDEAFDIARSYKPTANATTRKFVTFTPEDIFSKENKHITYLLEYEQFMPLDKPRDSIQFYSLIPPKGEDRFLGKTALRRSGIKKWRNITPDRSYFNPKRSLILFTGLTPRTVFCSV